MRLFFSGSKSKSLHGLFLLFWAFLVGFHPTIASRPTPEDFGKKSMNIFFLANASGNHTQKLEEGASGYHMQIPGEGEAVPENNITCVGKLPDLRLPLLVDGFNPNGASMQKLCAKTKYNGGQPGQHAGAYCWTRPGTYSHNTLGNDTTGDVGFDLTTRAQASSQLQNPRFLLACFYRCFCNHGLRNPSVQPKSKYAYFRTTITRSLFSYELQLDLDNDFTTPTLLKMGKQGGRRVKSTRVPERSEIDQTQAPSARMGREYLTLDPGNEIECRGDLPTFVLPAPYANSDFRSLQELCATQMNGGNMYANAGGYCHRSDTPNGPSNTVWFSDDQTPRLEWTWAGGDFFASASIRFLCWRRCACKNVKPTRDNGTLPLWAFVHGHALALRPSGAVVVQQETGPVPPGGEQETQVLPSQSGAGSPSGTCGASGKEFCPKAWPSDIYGEVPRAPPDTTDVIKPKAPSVGKTVCGNTCVGQADCFSSGTQYGCSCALPSVDDARMLGLDPVAPVAVCLVLFASSLKGHSLGGKRALVGTNPNDNEGLEETIGHAGFVDIRGVPHTCKCNATFKADECCTSKDGFVWLQ